MLWLPEDLGDGQTAHGRSRAIRQVFATKMVSWGRNSESNNIRCKGLGGRYFFVQVCALISNPVAGACLGEGEKYANKRTGRGDELYQDLSKAHILLGSRGTLSGLSKAASMWFSPVYATSSTLLVHSATVLWYSKCGTIIRPTIDTRCWGQRGEQGFDDLRILLENALSVYI